MEHAMGDITSEYWKPVMEKIQLAFKEGLYNKVKGVDVYRMYVRYKYVIYIAYVAAKDVEEQFTVFGWVLLKHPKPKWKSFEVSQSYVFKEVRGEGWAKLIYSTIINVEKLTLVSGDSQTKDGKKLWVGLVKSDRFHIWAHDLQNLKIRAEVHYDEETDSLWSPLKIYDDNESWKADVRLIAIKKEK